MQTLFGTDGIRGRANTYPMTPELALCVGRAIVPQFIRDNDPPLFVIGKDTRLSGDMIEAAIIAGVCSMGGNILAAGILPTPAVAFLARHHKAAAGIMISASHNPYYDNGIKIINGDGLKLPDAVEREIENRIASAALASGSETVALIGTVRYLSDSSVTYVDFLKKSMNKTKSLKGMKIVLDCSNGATCKVAPRVFSELGADVIPLFVEPDGMNINAKCGSQHPEHVMEAVVRHGAHVGLAFDGDGDRLIAVDEQGRRISGDQLLTIFAIAMKKAGTLANNLVVSTVMSNLGLKEALKEQGINHVAAQVGDRYVLEEMQTRGAVLGGEDSGHILFLDRHTTGDGIFAGLRLMGIMLEESRPLSELAVRMTIYPQQLINIEVSSTPDIESLPAVRDAIRSAEARLGDKGRVLVRYSGTRPLCRVMVEAPTISETERCCYEIAEIVKKTIGK